MAHTEEKQGVGHRNDVRYAFDTICWCVKGECWVAPGGEFIYNRPAAEAMARRIDGLFIAAERVPIVWMPRLVREAVAA